MSELLADERGMHTPGPWELEDGIRDQATPGVLPKWRLYSETHHDTTGMVGAGIVTYSRSTFAYLSARDADANLIAAAPEMLAMLRRVLGSAWTADDVRALITKAEGRS